MHWMEKITSVLAEVFVYERCKMTRSEMSVERIEWWVRNCRRILFPWKCVKCQEWLWNNNNDKNKNWMDKISKLGGFALKMNAIVYQLCLRSAITCGSEIWCLRERKVALLRRTKRAVIKAMWEVTLFNRKNTNELMQMFGITVLIERMVRAAAVRWYGQVLRREKDNILKEASTFEVIGRRKERKTKGCMEKTG